MVSQAKLFDEKTSLVYQVESLKDELEDTQLEVEELRAELHHHHSVSTSLGTCVIIICVTDRKYYTPSTKKKYFTTILINLRHISNIETPSWRYYNCIEDANNNNYYCYYIRPMAFICPRYQRKTKKRMLLEMMCNVCYAI